MFSKGFLFLIRPVSGRGSWVGMNEWKTNGPKCSIFNWVDCSQASSLHSWFPQWFQISSCELCCGWWWMSTVGGYYALVMCNWFKAHCVFRQVSVIDIFANCENDLFAIFPHNSKRVESGTEEWDWMNWRPPVWGTEVSVWGHRLARRQSSDNHRARNQLRNTVAKYRLPGP